jgi:hypothetical protein
MIKEKLEHISEFRNVHAYNFVQYIKAILDFMFDCVFAVKARYLLSERNIS